MFFTVLYRSPSTIAGPSAFDIFLSNIETLCVNIRNENPYAVFFTGDFNCYSQYWWPDGETSAEGNGIEEFTLSLGLTQIISEPTNFEPHKNPSCIDLIFSDQPYLIMESGTRSSLDVLCHHQIIFLHRKFETGKTFSTKTLTQTGNCKFLPKHY